MNKIKYRHLNIVANDWEKLANFYINALGCELIPPKRNLHGQWISKGVGVENAHIQGIHVRLPGHGENGTTIEILQYTQNLPKPPAAANRLGFTHIAFEVDDIEAIMKKVLEHGGGKLGEISSGNVEGTGYVTLVYLTDPEGNIVELQSWK